MSDRAGQRVCVVAYRDRLARPTTVRASVFPRFGTELPFHDSTSTEAFTILRRNRERDFRFDPLARDATVLVDVGEAVAAAVKIKIQGH